MVRLVVGLEPDADEAALVRRIEQSLGPRGRVVPQFPGVLLVVAEEAGVGETLARMDGVRYVEADQPYQAFDGG